MNNNNYLIIPPMPTPNGGLHLGHAGGPYLGADILARHLRLLGNRVLVLSGTDTYESYVLKQAETERATPEEVCHRYHQIIQDDFDSMQIYLDKFINPLDPEWKQSFTHWHHSIYQLLQSRKVTQSVKEQMLWDAESERYVTGCWLEGLCPVCGAEIGGYFCDECGAHFRPEEVRHAYRHAPRTMENIFLTIPAGFDLARKGANHQVQAHYDNFLRQQGNLLRLTTASDWGLPAGEHKTLFSYGFVFAYYLLLGEIAGSMFGGGNAFAADSGVISIASFGIDNAVPVLGSVLGFSAHCPEYKPVDYYLVNYFYYLNDSKFSTSRRYAIWVNDIIHRAHAASDIIRLYLASIDVRKEHSNFDSQDFILQYNMTMIWIIQSILKPLETLTAPDCGPGDIAEKFQAVLESQSRTLRPDNFLPHEAVKTIDQWLRLGEQIARESRDFFWWLKGLALLINPFMPQLSERLWVALGYRGEPRSAGFSALPLTPLKRKLSINLKTMSAERLQQCLQGVSDATNK